MSTQVFAVMVERRGSGILYIEAADADEARAVVLMADENPKSNMSKSCARNIHIACRYDECGCGCHKWRESSASPTPLLDELGRSAQ